MNTVEFTVGDYVNEHLIAATEAKHGHVYWRVECSRCGRTRKVRTSTLRTGLACTCQRSSGTPMVSANGPTIDDVLRTQADHSKDLIQLSAAIYKVLAEVQTLRDDLKALHTAQSMNVEAKPLHEPQNVPEKLAAEPKPEPKPEPSPEPESKPYPTTLKELYAHYGVQSKEEAEAARDKSLAHARDLVLEEGYSEAAAEEARALAVLESQYLHMVSPEIRARREFAIKEILALSR
jgi:hypothetical protein